MISSREPIFQALFELISSCAPFITTSRCLQLWSDVDPSRRPALFMYEGDEEYKGGSRNVPPITILNVEFFIYANTSDSSAPGSVLNPLLDAIDQVLALNPVTNRQSLGNLVDNAWIEGKILKEFGLMDGTALAVIPVKVLVQ